MPSVSAVWREVQARLEGVREVGPREGKALVQAVLGWDDTQILMRGDEVFPDEKLIILNDLADRRMGGEPLGYVLGEVWFYGHKWVVKPGTLIPRPDTEVLVEAVLARVKHGDRVVEVGVGGGCAAGAVLLENKDVFVTGIDLSSAALAVARENWERIEPTGARWRLVEADGLDGWREPIDLLMSNPPYVTDGEWEALEDEVKDFEPRLALTGAVPNPDGLVFYRRLAQWGCDLVKPGGWLCMETGWQQARAVTELLQQEGHAWCDISILKDLGGRERVVCARRC